MRIVLDTNQLVRALMRPPELATFLMAWEAKRFSVICSPALLDEYERVLAHPDVAKLIFPELLRTFRSHLLYDIEMGLSSPPCCPAATRLPLRRFDLAVRRSRLHPG